MQIFSAHSIFCWAVGAAAIDVAFHHITSFISYEVAAQSRRFPSENAAIFSCSFNFSRFISKHCRQRFLFVASNPFNIASGLLIRATDVPYTKWFKRPLTGETRGWSPSAASRLSIKDDFAACFTRTSLHLRFLNGTVSQKNESTQKRITLEGSVIGRQDFRMWDNSMGKSCCFFDKTSQKFWWWF